MNMAARAVDWQVGDRVRWDGAEPRDVGVVAHVATSSVRVKWERDGSLLHDPNDARLVLVKLGWTGSNQDGVAREFSEGPIPEDRWPYGERSMHDDFCMLRSGGVFCDCSASAQEPHDLDRHR